MTELIPKSAKSCHYLALFIDHPVTHGGKNPKKTTAHEKTKSKRLQAASGKVSHGFTLNVILAKCLSKIHSVSTNKNKLREHIKMK